MSHWYRKVVSDLKYIPDAFDYFENEYEIAKNELPFKGRVEHLAQKISGVVQYRTAQLYEIEAIMKYLDLLKTKKLTEKIKLYTEHYQRKLTDHAARRYAEGDTEVIDLEELKLQMGVVRDKFLSLTKGWDIMQYQITNVVALRKAGIEDSVI